MDAGEFPLVIGGDHSIAMGTVSGVSAHYRERGEEMGLIWFDAHGDMNIPGVSPSGNIHGMPLAHLLGRGDPDLAGILGFSPKLNPDKVVLIGIRDIDAGERKIINESGIHVFTMRDIDEHGMAKVARKAMEIVTNGTAGFHVSFDVDGCDPSVIPGSGTLVHGGVRYREAHLLLEYCADSRMLTSMEVVELNPFIDHRQYQRRTHAAPDYQCIGKKHSIAAPYTGTIRIRKAARVAKLVDARDLKSLGRNTVPVRFRSRAPLLAQRQEHIASSCRSPFKIK